MVKRIIIIGATSGIGYEVAKIYWKRGYQLGLAGRRVDRLEEFRKQDPEHIRIKQLDVTAEDAADRLDELIRDLGGMDIFLLSSGIGNQNKYLDTYDTDECDGFYTYGTSCLSLFFQSRWWAYICNQLYCRNQRIRCRSLLLGYQTIPKYLYRRFSPTFPYGETAYYIYGYPSGICPYGFIERRQELSYADVSPIRRLAYR